MSPVEKIIKEKLIPALLDGFPISEEFRKLLVFLCKPGGKGVIDPTENANGKYNNSSELTSQLTHSIKQQEHCYTMSDKAVQSSSNKAVHTGLLYYLLNNLDFHFQKQNSGMQSIYDMGYH